MHGDSPNGYHVPMVERKFDSTLVNTVIQLYSYALVLASVRCERAYPHAEIINEYMIEYRDSMNCFIVPTYIVFYFQPAQNQPIEDTSYGESYQREKR